MRLTSESVELALIHAFRISRSTDTHKQNVIVSLSDNGYTGIGEAAPSVYYDESQERVLDTLALAPPFLGDDP
ncbi:uncharacterized protein METZ01_LOCUS377127, partial [marine metagenome]